MSPVTAMIIGIILISAAAACGAVGTYVFKYGWDEQQKAISEQGGARHNVALQVIEIVNTDVRDKTVTRVLKLRAMNVSEKPLTSFRLVMDAAEGPKEWEKIESPKTIRLPPAMNPQDYVEFPIASYTESPKSNQLGLLVGDDPLFVGLINVFSASTAVEYSFFATSAESLRATIKVTIWVKDGTLLHK